MKRIPGTHKWVCEDCGAEFYVGACGGGIFLWCPTCNHGKEEAIKARKK